MRTRALGQLATEPVLVCNEAHRFLAEQQLAEIGAQPKFLLEPEGRNTAPAVALAAMLPEIAPDDLLLVLPADHIIEDTRALADAMNLALSGATAGRSGALGVVPTAAATG